MQSRFQDSRKARVLARRGGSLVHIFEIGPRGRMYPDISGIAEVIPIPIASYLLKLIGKLDSWL